jgi:hypothetical protein
MKSSSSSREVTETDDADCIVGRGGAVLAGGGRWGPGVVRGEFGYGSSRAGWIRAGDFWVWRILLFMLGFTVTEGGEGWLTHRPRSLTVLPSHSS